MSRAPFILMALFMVTLHVAPLLAMFGRLPGARTFYIVDSATLIPIWLALRWFAKLKPSQASQPLIGLDRAVLCYLAISLASVVMFLRPDNPSHYIAFAYGVHLCVLPMSLYFAAKSLTPEQRRSLLVFVCFLNMAAMWYGFYLHYLRPDFYREYLATTLLYSKHYTEDWQMFSRLQSYLGSTIVGSVSAISIALVCICRAPTVMMVATVMTMFAAVFLSQQRGGMAATVLVAFYAVILRKTSWWIRIAVLLAGTIGIIQSFGLFSERHDSLSELLATRFTENLSEVAENRGYGPGIAYFLDFPFGVGLGGTTSAAESAELTSRGQVVDANFMRILADLGIQGLLAFAFVIVSAVVAAWRTSERYGWISLIGAVMLICIGTNTLDTHYVSHLFWLCLGVLSASASQNQGKAIRQPFVSSPRLDARPRDPEESRVAPSSSVTTAGV